MSKWIEYLKLIPGGVKNIDRLAEGIVNQIKLQYGSIPEDEQIEIFRRRMICEGCPFMSENAKHNPAINYKTDRLDMHCIHCGCPLVTRTASLTSNCGIESYNKEHPDNPMELKWEAYTKKSENGN